MKDAYSFDIDDESANASYQRMYDAYSRIFARCGLQAFRCRPTPGYGWLTFLTFWCRRDRRKRRSVLREWRLCG